MALLKYGFHIKVQVFYIEVHKRKIPAFPKDDIKNLIMNLAFLDVTTPMDPRHFSNKLHIGEHIRSIICKMITERSNLKYHISGTFLVVQWLRIYQPMQATRVRSLVQEDTTCCRAVKPMHHHY